MVDKKYITEAENYINIMLEAIKRDDLRVFDAAKSMLEETISDYKEEKSLVDEMDTTNFGVLNHIFEEALPNLLKKNKPAVRKVLKLIKEDKTLRSEFNFYNTIRNYNSSVSKTLSPEEMIKKLNESILLKIDRNELSESNKKLRDVMLKSGMVPESHVTGEKRDLYEFGDTLLRMKPSAGNILKLHESEVGIINYLDTHKDDQPKSMITPDMMIEEFEKKLKDTLNESEISFVQEITDFKNPIAEQRKEKLFNKFKKECVDKINEMLSKDSENVELKALREQLEAQKFNKDSIVKDIAKLLEIRDILMDD